MGLHVRKFIPANLFSAYHYFLALLGAVFYRFPSRHLIVVGVTGTNGKSTVVEMCHQILQEAGYGVASISSIRFKINGDRKLNDLKMTMPGRFRLQQFLRQALIAGCKYVVLEVTSEGIKQYRHKFIDFDCAVFTNLTPEHIESHGGFDKYKKAKGELFKALANKKTSRKITVVNLDDPNAEFFLGFPADEKIGYKLSGSSAANEEVRLVVEGVNYKETESGLTFCAEGVEFQLSLLGKFNIYNALAAICVGLSQKVPLTTIKASFSSIENIPGRMDVVAKNPFLVVVDYAHTPDALEKVYQTLSGINNGLTKRMICILGSAGGGRDKWKRPELGKIAAQYCGQIILTNEDPYDEDGKKILAEVEGGIKSNIKLRNAVKYEQILDRREAIRSALSAAQPNDIVIITGKGCEPWMCVAGDKKIPWDDRKIAKEELRALGY